MSILLVVVILILLGVASRYMPSPISNIVAWGVGIAAIIVLLALFGLITLPFITV